MALEIEASLIQRDGRTGIIDRPLNPRSNGGQAFLVLFFSLLPDAQRLADQLAGRRKIPRLDALLDDPVHLRRKRNADFFGCGQGRIVSY